MEQQQIDARLRGDHWLVRHIVSDPKGAGPYPVGSLLGGAGGIILAQKRPSCARGNTSDEAGAQIVVTYLFQPGDWKSRLQASRSAYAD
jgi:hypothetical protein